MWPLWMGCGPVREATDAAKEASRLVNAPHLAGSWWLCLRPTLGPPPCTSLLPRRSRRRMPKSVCVPREREREKDATKAGRAQGARLRP